MQTIRGVANNRRGGTVTVRIASLLIKSFIIIISVTVIITIILGGCFLLSSRHTAPPSPPQHIQTIVIGCCYLTIDNTAVSSVFLASIRSDGHFHIYFSSVEQSRMQQTVRVVVYTPYYACCSRHLQYYNYAVGLEDVVLTAMTVRAVCLLLFPLVSIYSEYE